MLNNNTQTIINLLSEKEITVKEAVKALNTNNVAVDYRTVYRVFRTHGVLVSKGKFVVKNKPSKLATISSTANQTVSESNFAAETNNKAA